MKYEQFLKRVLASSHPSWMAEQDKHEFETEIIRDFGEKIDETIESGILNGLPEEQIESIIKLFIHQ